MKRATALFSLLLLFPFFLWSQTPRPSGVDREPVVEALSWVRYLPSTGQQFDYIMTARVRLLFFWASKDDVGGGYIRRGFSPDDPRQEVFQVLFGSDPAKAPRAINRWGAGTEIAWHRAPSATYDNSDVVSSVFFGFMKSSRGKSVSEIQNELKKENENGEHLFSGILSRAEPGKALSLIVPMASDQDFNLHDYGQASALMFEKISASDRSPRVSGEAAACPRASEFLATVSELLQAALKGAKTPTSLCYIYDAQVHTLTLEQVESVPALAVKIRAARGASTLQEQTYQHLLQAEFSSVQRGTQKRSAFTILVGTEGNLRGVPVQIRYQPNWWFEVVLNLKTPQSAAPGAKS